MVYIPTIRNHDDGTMTKTPWFFGFLSGFPSLLKVGGSGWGYGKGGPGPGHGGGQHEDIDWATAGLERQKCDRHGDKGC